MTTKKTFEPGRGYTQEDWDAVDSPDLTDEELKTARPFAEMFPELAASIRREREQGRERKHGPGKTKAAVTIRLDFDILDTLRASGPGWQSRVNGMLRKSLGLETAELP